MSWKMMLYEYVHHKNQMNLDYSVEPLLPFVTDVPFLQAQIRRLARTSQNDQDRHYSPVKNETRLTITQTTEQPAYVTASIRLRQSMVGIIGVTEHQEKRLESEQLTFEEQEGKWVITNIQSTGNELLQPTQRVVMSPSAASDAQTVDQGLLRLSSMPFLNYEVLPYLEPALRKSYYDRHKAVQYADRWWDQANPAYLEFEVDCSNYISQCLFAGEAPMHYTGKRDSGWWYKGRNNSQELWSFSWAVAQSLQGYMTSNDHGLRAKEVHKAENLELGDVISYDWNGDGRYRHSTIVTAKDANGMPLVNAHTTNSKHRYWSYKDSYAWTEQTRYRFLHVIDQD